VKRWCHPEPVEGLERWQLRDDYVAGCSTTIELLLRSTLVVWKSLQRIAEIFSKRKLLFPRNMPIPLIET
jgi:hypothetical protein